MSVSVWWWSARSRCYSTSKYCRIELTLNRNMTTLRMSYAHHENSHLQRRKLQTSDILLQEMQRNPPAQQAIAMALTLEPDERVARCNPACGCPPPCGRRAFHTCSSWQWRRPHRPRRPQVVTAINSMRPPALSCACLRHDSPANAHGRAMSLSDRGRGAGASVAGTRSLAARGMRRPASMPSLNRFWIGTFR